MKWTPHDHAAQKTRPGAAGTRGGGRNGSLARPSSPLVAAL